MDSGLMRSVVFLALAAITIVLAYLYQRNERKQRVAMIWLWPAIFVVMAVAPVTREFKSDPEFPLWFAIALLLGIAIGAFRGLIFGLRPGERAGEMLLRPNLITGIIYVALLIVNEYVHVFYHGDPNLQRVVCGFLVMTVGNSAAVNLTRAIRYRNMI